MNYKEWANLAADWPTLKKTAVQQHAGNLWGNPGFQAILGWLWGAYTLQEFAQQQAQGSSGRGGWGGRRPFLNRIDAIRPFLLHLLAGNGLFLFFGPMKGSRGLTHTTHS
jgi:hypothetical protein